MDCESAAFILSSGDQLDSSMYIAEGYNAYFSFCRTKSGYSGEPIHTVLVQWANPFYTHALLNTRWVGLAWPAMLFYTCIT